MKNCQSAQIQTSLQGERAKIYGSVQVEAKRSATTPYKCRWINLFKRVINESYENYNLAYVWKTQEGNT